MNPSENKTSKSNLLLPLAIGAGFLLLLVSMRSKAQDSPNEEASSNSPDPEIKQLIPDAAPKYSELAPSSSEYNADEDAMEEGAIPSGQAKEASAANRPNEETAEEEDNTTFPNATPYSYEYPKEKGASKSNSQSKWNLPQPKPIIGNGKAKMGMKPFSDQNRKFTERAGIVHPKAAKLNKMRSQGEQAKLWLQRSGIKPTMPQQLPILKKVPSNPIKNTTNRTSLSYNKNKPKPKSQSVAKIFPLKQGQSNNYIKEVQRKLGLPSTGFFGTQTRAALLKRYKVADISEALYKQIITGKVAPSKTPFKK
jgi:hypothetical protein